jgi:hypothetical protein
MVYYDKYLIQALKIIMDRGNLDVTIQDFEKLFEIYTEKCEAFEAEKLLDKITKLVGQSVDWNFFYTPVGRVIGAIKFRDDLLVVKEVAELLKVRVQYVMKILPELEAKRPGGVWLIRESKLNDWLIKKDKPQLQELKLERSNNNMTYKIEEERIINPECENEEEYKA